jgi:hypothetical protein
MKLVCELFGHHRSKQAARPLGGHRWRSVCSRCHAPMVRLGPKDWAVVDRDSDALKEDRAFSRLVPPAVAAASSPLTESDELLPA